MNAVDQFNEYRPLLFSIAYRMLGTVMDAEDVVQEAFLRWHRADKAEIQSPRAFLTTVVTRLSIDQLRSARTQREVYIGPWLPEPLLAEELPAGEDKAELADSLSMAFLVLLESLSPVERAAFLLREVFDYEYGEIASMLDKSEANCRQMVHRAHQYINQRRPRFEVSGEQRQRITEQFIQTCYNGDMQGLLALLNQDITLWADGGGKVTAAPKPIHGSSKVARFILGVLKKIPPNVEVRQAEINGQPGVIAYLEGQPFTTLTLDLTPQGIRSIQIVINPDKLANLPPPPGV